MRSTRHEYLRMWLDYSVKGTAHISIEDYPKGFIKYFQEEITEEYNIPEVSNPSDVRYSDVPKRVLLDKKHVREFHHTVNAESRLRQQSYLYQHECGTLKRTNVKSYDGYWDTEGHQSNC